MSSLEVNAQVRAAAVQAATQALGERSYRHGGAGYGYWAAPSKSLVELTSRIEDYIRHGKWSGDKQDGS